MKDEKRLAVMPSIFLRSSTYEQGQRIIYVMYKSSETSESSQVIPSSSISPATASLYLCEDSVDLSPAHDQLCFLISYELQTLELLQRAGVERL